MKNTKQILSELGIDVEPHIVVASGILNALGIRESDDIDVIVNEDTYNRYKNHAGWKEIDKGEYKVLINGPVEMGLSWDSKDEEPNLEDLLKTSVIIDMVKYTNLERVKSWKQKMSRPKDLLDIRLIDNYLKRN